MRVGYIAWEGVRKKSKHIHINMQKKILIITKHNTLTVKYCSNFNKTQQLHTHINNVVITNNTIPKKNLHL